MLWRRCQLLRALSSMTACLLLQCVALRYYCCALLWLIWRVGVRTALQQMKGKPSTQPRCAPLSILQSDCTFPQDEVAHDTQVVVPR